MLPVFFSGPAGAATTFTVNTNADDGDIAITNSRRDPDPANGGQCTLRAAIEEANDTSGDDTIAFDLDGASGQTISPTSALPAITDTLTTDGYTQPGASPNTHATGNDAALKVQLDGLDAGPGVVGLMVEATDTTIKGLVIKRFDDYGIHLLAVGEAGNGVEGNFIGVAPDLTPSALPYRGPEMPLLSDQAHLPRVVLEGRRRARPAPGSHGRTRTQRLRRTAHGSNHLKSRRPARPTTGPA